MEEIRVFSVQSWVVRGYVGNRAALVPLTLHGIETDVLNTVQLSNHTGYASTGGQVLGDSDLFTLTAQLEKNEISSSYTHALTGYVGSTEFLRRLGSALNGIKKERGDRSFTLFIDPVLGDTGPGFYVPKENVGVYKELLIPLARCLTPNQFELEHLTGQTVANEAEALEAIAALHRQGPPIVVVTSTELGPPGTIRGFASDAETGEKIRFDVPRLPHQFVGTGDLFSALLLTWLEKHRKGLREALSLTLGSLKAVLAATSDHARALKDPPGPLQLELRLVQNPLLLTQPQPHPVTLL